MGRSQQYGSNEMSRASTCLFYLLVFITQALLFAVLIMSLLWALLYKGGFGGPMDFNAFFNLHPVLMTTGLIFLTGQAMLVYRLFRCCNSLAGKILHFSLHLLTIPCIIFGPIPADQYKYERTGNGPMPPMYSLHSWLGTGTLGLFGLQFVAGFFSFCIMSCCCDSSTASYRAKLLPVHSTFGIITFILAIATALTGYTEKTIVDLGVDYVTLDAEVWFVNANAMCLAALVVLMCILFSQSFSRRTSPVAFVQPPSSNNHYVISQKTYYYRKNEHEP